VRFCAGKTAVAKFLLHDHLADAAGGSSPLFTTAEMDCVLTPEVPLPQKFITSITWANPGANNAPFLSHLYTKTIFLTRQAWDKRRKR
jgi:hypothetical protein